MAGRNVHTVYNSTGRNWANKYAGGSAFDSHATKEPAVAAGRLAAIREKSEHIVHNMDGSIAYRNSYGNDPYPPKG